MIIVLFNWYFSKFGSVYILINRTKYWLYISNSFWIEPTKYWLYIFLLFYSYLISFVHDAACIRLNMDLDSGQPKLCLVFGWFSRQTGILWYFGHNFVFVASINVIQIFEESLENVLQVSYYNIFQAWLKIHVKVTRSDWNYLFKLIRC
jgi:hypothetical protein